MCVCMCVFIVLQKFFDLERENACVTTKEQKNHTFPKLNRNKYMVTDGAAYIGRCLACAAPVGVAPTVPLMVREAPQCMGDLGGQEAVE